MLIGLGHCRWRRRTCAGRTEAPTPPRPRKSSPRTSRARPLFHLVRSLLISRPPFRKATIAVVPDEKQAVDFFKRPIALKAKTEEEERARLFLRFSSSRSDSRDQAVMPPPPKRAKQAVYRFHEGFSNAVRLTKRVADFL